MCLHTSIFIKTPSLEGLQTKAREDPSPHEMRLCSARQTYFLVSRNLLLLLFIIIIIIIIIIISLCFSKILLTAREDSSFCHRSLPDILKYRDYRLLENSNNL